MDDHKRGFFELAIGSGVLRFGTFTLKSGRVSPYFFNAGLFHSGPALAALGDFYAHAAATSGADFDLVFGPAYKGIPLAATTVIGLARLGRDVPFAFNRKEMKDHGEGGLVVGHPLAGRRVLIVDDVISSGGSVAESVQLIRAQGGTTAGVVIALDRQERGLEAQSAVGEVQTRFHIPVFSVATLTDLIDYLGSRAGYEAELAAMGRYRAQYGCLPAARFP